MTDHTIALTIKDDAGHGLVVTPMAMATRPDVIASVETIHDCEVWLTREDACKLRDHLTAVLHQGRTPGQGVSRRGGAVTRDASDPNTWPHGQQRVLRAVLVDGGWYAGPGAPSGSARVALERRLDVSFQREHLLHEPPWYQPASAEDRTILTDYARRLDTEGSRGLR